MLKMQSSMRSKQKGMSFIGLVLLGVFSVAVFAIAGRSAPMWSEYFSIKKAVQKASLESTPMAVRASFDRTAAVDFIESVKGNDLIIGKRGDKLVVNFKYTREIELAGPAYLVYRFEGRSE
jgi:hypothetical protein